MLGCWNLAGVINCDAETSFIRKHLWFGRMNAGVHSVELCSTSDVQRYPCPSNTGRFPSKVCTISVERIRIWRMNAKGQVCCIQAYLGYCVTPSNSLRTSTPGCIAKRVCREELFDYCHTEHSPITYDRNPSGLTSHPELRLQIKHIGLNSFKNRICWL
jgi:hypothetical protein